jgi:hypothetical protein
MMNIITEQNYNDTKERLERSVAAGMKLEASVETVAAMFTGGVARAIYNWLADGKLTSPAEFADEVGRLVRSCIKE